MAAKKCPDCEGSMWPINIIDRSGDFGNRISNLEYTVPEAKVPFWIGKYPTEGEIRSVMCDDCGRVLLYGFPHGWESNDE